MVALAVGDELTPLPRTAARNNCAFLLELQLSPASSFGGSALTRPPFNDGSTPGTTVASTATRAIASSGQTGAHWPLDAKAGLFSSVSRSGRHGCSVGALSAGGAGESGAKKKVRQRT